MRDPGNEVVFVWDSPPPSPRAYFRNIIDLGDLLLQVDMPVFFYIDPEFTEDPAMVKVDMITLSYTFFEAKEAEKLGL